MNFLTIDPQQVRVKCGEKTYELVGFPPLPFDYTYLYYEPATNHTRKVITVDGQLVYDALTEAEMTVIEETIANDALMQQYQKVYEVFEAPAPTDDFVPEVDHCADGEGKYQGIRAITAGYVKVPVPPESKFDSFLGVVQRWNSITNAWEIHGGYGEKRKAEYLQQTPIGAQLGALIAAVDALSKGQPVPVEFTEIVAKIAAIKTAIPKE